MDINEICERLKNVKSTFNEKVYTINEERLTIKAHTLLGFIKLDEGDEQRTKYVYYAYIDGEYPVVNQKIEINKLYSNETLAKEALNKIIQQKVDCLLAKKL
jgi:hypothetical protein